MFANAAFVYDGDGKRVKSVINAAETTYFVGAHYEVTDGVVTKYYYVGAQRIAMRTNGTLNYLLGDHLGSTSLTTDASGNVISELRYKAWGEVRYASGVTPTDYTYTGQYSYTSDFGLMYYNARWYDPSLGRFGSADTVIPSGVHGYDRYNYVNNRPTVNTDPTGHRPNVDGDKPDRPPCARKPSKDAKEDLDNLPTSADDYLSTYTVANIALQKGPPARFAQWLAVKWKGKYASEGPAKVTDAEMETAYGSAINGGKNNYGLGLRPPGATTPDQNDMAVAVTAMSTRIQVRLDKCENTKFPCTPTDIFIAAALGGDNGIAPGDLRDLGNGVYGGPDPTTGTFPWGKYLAGVENKSHNLSVIQQFVDNVAYLEDQGAAVPDNIDWTYVCDLVKKK